MHMAQVKSTVRVSPIILFSLFSFLFSLLSFLFSLEKNVKKAPMAVRTLRCARRVKYFPAGKICRRTRHRDDAAAMMKPAKETEELAFGLVGNDVFPRPADCGMPIEVAFKEEAGYKQWLAAISRRHRGACLGVDAVVTAWCP